MVIAILVAWPASMSHADTRSDYLVRLLSKSDAFRVRVQAALSLGQVAPSKNTVRALSKALRDRHAAVRVAAASSLLNLGQPEALPALRRAKKDKNKSVRRAARSAVAAIEARMREHDDVVRYYVSVSSLGTKDEAVSSRVLSRAKHILAAKVSDIEGVELAPDGEPKGRARQTLVKRKLTGYALESSVVKVEDHPQGTRVVVSMVLTTYPGRDMRAMLTGSAIATDGVGPAVEGALEGALRRLPAAMKAADARSSL